MNESKVTGFSLGGYAYGEGDRLALFFTREMGKIRVAARGARKSGSKTSVLTELFNECELALTRRSGSEVHTLIQGRLLDARIGLKSHLASLSALQVLSDILRSALPDDEPQPELFRVLENTLNRIALAPNRPETSLAAFILRFLDLGGYPLSLEVCASCGEAARGPGCLSVRRGGWACAECVSSPGEGPDLSAGALVILKKLREEGSGTISAALAAHSRPAFKAAALYLSHTLEHELATVEYFLKVTESLK